MTEYKTGDEIIVTIGSREFTTVIDKHGTQRFKKNTVINAWVDASGKEFEKWLRTDRTTPEPFNLNVLGLEYLRGEHTLDDMLTFYTSIGYSVSGFSDLSFFDDLDIRNPIWEEDHYKKLSSKALVEFMSLINEPYEHNGNEAVRFIFDVVRDGKWTTDDNGNFIAREDTIDRVIYSFLEHRNMEPYNILIKEDTSEELKAFLKNLS
jgi:hypothetical protein